MAEFSRLVITGKGQALLAKMMTGEGNVEFTKISTSDMEYTLEQLEELTELSGVKQTVSVAKVTRTNGVAVTIEATFDNTELTQGYHMRALGLYAIDPDDGEILYAVTAEMSGCCYMPAYNGVTVSGACIKLVTTVGNAENVSLEVDPGVYATVGEIKELRESVDGIETWKDSTQKRLDNWGPTIVGHGQIINNNRDRITSLDSRIEVAEQSIEEMRSMKLVQGYISPSLGDSGEEIVMIFDCGYYETENDIPDIAGIIGTLRIADYNHKYSSNLTIKKMLQPSEYYYWNKIEQKLLQLNVSIPENSAAIIYSFPHRQTVKYSIITQKRLTISFTVNSNDDGTTISNFCILDKEN